MTRLLAAGLLVAGCLGPVSALYPPSPDDPARPVWVIGHGWHVGLALRRGDVSTDVWPERMTLGSFAHLEVGWGDGAFYPAGTGTVGAALKAAFRSESSVLQVVAFEPSVTIFFPHSPIVEIQLGQRGLDALGRFVEQTYARAASGEPLPIAPALYGDGWFYRASGRYGLLTNSNTWVARALRAAGCPITPLWGWTASNVLWQSSRFGRVLRSEAGTHPAGATAFARAGEASPPR